MQDKAGNIWVGTLTNGLWKSPDTINFTQIVNSDQGLQSISNIMQDNKGNIWLATEDSGLWKSSDGKTFDVIIDDPGQDSQINNIVQDKEGNIWVGSKYGLSKSTDYKNFESVIIGSRDIYVSSLFLDSNKDIWIGTYENGLINNINPYHFEYTSGAQSTTKWINDKRYYLSNKSINLIVNPVDEININGNIEPKTTTVKTFNLKEIDSPFNITIKKWNHTYAFNVVILNKISVPNSNFTTGSPSIITQYDGYLLGNEDRPEKIKSAINPTGKANLNITKFDLNQYIDYQNSYYIKLDSNFKPQSSKISLNPDGTQINALNKTFYLLHIQNYIGYVETFYLQVGGTLNSIPSTATTDSGVHTSGKVKKDIDVHGVKYDYITNETATFYNNDKDITTIIINGITYNTNLKRTFELADDPATHGIYKIQTFINHDPKVNQTINVLVRSKININPESAFTNNQGLTVNNYFGYIKFEGKLQKENILAILDNKYTKATNLSLDLKYSALDSTFNPIGDKKIITSESQSISQKGIYKMVLTDLIGNTNTYYI